MRDYLFEMHAHTSQTSRCGEVPAEQVVSTFKGLGYDGIVITDHMHTGTMEKIASEPWEKKADHFFEGYRAAKALETEDFTVLLGMELRFLENDNDYLVYGLLAPRPRQNTVSRGLQTDSGREQPNCFSGAPVQSGHDRHRRRAARRNRDI